MRTVEFTFSLVDTTTVTIVSLHISDIFTYISLTSALLVSTDAFCYPDELCKLNVSILYLYISFIIMLLVYLHLSIHSSCIYILFALGASTSLFATFCLLYCLLVHLYQIFLYLLCYCAFKCYVLLVHMILICYCLLLVHLPFSDSRSLYHRYYLLVHIQPYFHHIHCPYFLPVHC